MQNVSLTIRGNDKYITFLELIIGSNHLMTAASVEQNCIFMFLMHRSFKVMSRIESKQEFNRGSFMKVFSTFNYCSFCGSSM